jgi:hypothetical protein
MGLFSRFRIVEWEPGYYPDISTANSAQKKSYEIIKQSIYNGEYIECSDAYLYAYGYELNSKIVKNTSQDLSTWLRLFEAYKKFIGLYESKKPKVTSYMYPWAVLALVLTKNDIREFLEQYLEFYMRNNLSGYYDFITSLYMTSHQIYSSSDKVEGRLFRAFTGEDLRKHMTQTGKKFYEEVVQVVDVLLQGDYDKHKINYLYRLYDFEDGVIQVSLNEFSHFSVVAKKDAYEGHEGYNLQILFPTYNPTKKTAYLKNIIREAENLVRMNKGLQKIGEGWVSETLLFRQIESAFRPVVVTQHASPSFLGKQHYDVYLPEYKVALEYQGDQHSRPIEFFGGEEAFLKGKERDKRKRQASNNNDIYQIDVYPGYELKIVVNDVASHIYDTTSINYAKLVADAIDRAENAAVTVKDLSVSHAIAIDKLANVSDEAEMDDYRYELMMKKMVNAIKKSDVIDRTDFIDLPHDQFEQMIEKLNEVKEVGKTDAVRSNELAFTLMESGYRAPAIYERIAINYRKLELLEDELNILLQAKKDFGYNFDDRIKKVLKKIYN